MATATALKPFTGTFLYPGVSLNNCLYTKELIGKAVERMQARIADPDGLPITMRTHHAAGDNSHLIVATVLRATQAPDGSARYEARWYDTAPARDIAALVQPPDGGPPGLKSVSIHGYFLGETSMVDVDGRPAMTGEDLEIDSIDFTATPGVVQALIDSPDRPQPPTESAPATAGRTPIAETWEVPVATVITEEAATPVPEAAPAPTGPFADPGYQQDKQKRHPLDTKARAKAAWSYIHQPDNASLYTSAQLKRIKDKIRKALKNFGVTVSAENWLIETAAPVTESLAECWDMASTGGDIYISLTNGPTTVSVTSRLIDAHDLQAVGLAAMTGAVGTLTALDPDLDDDIDVEGAPAEDTDRGLDNEPGDEEDPDMADEPQPGSGCPCGCGCSVPHQMAGGPGCPCPCSDCEVCNSTPAPANETAPAATPQSSTPTPAVEPAPPVKESVVSDVTPAAETAAPVTNTPTTAQAVAPLMVSLTQEQFAQLLGSIAPAAPVTESAPATATGEPTPAPIAPAAPAAQEAAAQIEETYTKAQVDEAINAAMKDAIPQLLAAYGLPQRTGHRTTETDSPDAKPKTGAEMWDDRADLLLGNFGKAAV
jgi:hypothetical protein